MSNGVHSGGGGTCPGGRSFFEERLFHMVYEKEEILQYIIEEDVKFIRMTFCDVMGKLKNVSIMPDELDRAFDYGIAIDASAVAGFGGEVYSDLVLRPDASTLCILPWRPEHGRVVRMFCSVHYPDGRPFEADTRAILTRAVEDARKEGYTFFFGPEMEFYLFRLDESGVPTKTPYDHAGYMDVAPEDKGENVRREACLTLEQMGIRPESSHHEEGPGQNEIDFRYADPITAADNAVTFKSVIATVAAGNGLCADFSPKPLPDAPGSGMHINLSVKSADGTDVMPQVMAGILARAYELSVFLNPLESSYRRFGCRKAPRYISWSSENRSQLIRIPAASGEYRRAELRSPDPSCNPYLAFALLIYAGLDGIRCRLPLPAPADVNLFTAPESVTSQYRTLPANLDEAKQAARSSEFAAAQLPKRLLDYYTR